MTKNNAVEQLKHKRITSTAGNDHGQSAQYGISLKIQLGKF